MNSSIYSEFAWQSENAANGESGVGLSRAFIEIITSLRNVTRICDLGCGNGYMTVRLAHLGYDVTGVDASETGLKIARQQHSEVRFVHSLIDSTLNDRCELGKFDLVISSDVIEHLYRPADLLEAASSLLKPNGQILIGTPYHGYIKNLALSISGKMDSHFTVLEDCGHIKFFSVKTLSALIGHHGFSDLRFSFYGRAPWLWKNMICHGRRNT